MNEYLRLRNDGSIVEEKINKNRLTVILKSGGQLIFEMDKEFKKVVG